MQNNPQLSIRLLTATDQHAAEDLARIMIAAWHSGFRGILPDSVIETYTRFESCTDMFRQLIASGAGTLYLARSDRQAVGLLYLISEDRNARIEALLTVPEVWGSGIASALLERAAADAASCHTITVWPFTENHRARRFYEKYGFSVTGSTRIGDAPEVEYVRFHS